MDRGQSIHFNYGDRWSIVCKKNENTKLDENAPFQFQIKLYQSNKRD